MTLAVRYHIYLDVFIIHADWKYSGLRRLCDRNKLNKNKSNWQEGTASTLPETFNVSRWTERDTV